MDRPSPILPDFPEQQSWAYPTVTTTTTTITRLSGFNPATHRSLTGGDRKCASPVQWTAPPVPPIPDTDDATAAWRRRSMKRDSYTSRSLKTHSTYSHVGEDPTMANRMRLEVPLRPSSAYWPILNNDHPRRRPGIDNWDPNWEFDRANPKNWSAAKRCFVTLVPLLYGFTIMLASSVLAPYGPIIRDGDALSSPVAELPHSLFLIGLALAPLTGAPSEVFGRKWVITAGMLLFTIFTLIGAFSGNVPTFIVTRFLAGLSVSSCLATGPAVLCDVWAARQRTTPMVLYITMLGLGTAFGVFIGGIVFTAKPLIWTQFLVLFALAVCALPVLLLPETSPHIIQRRQKPSNSEPKALKMATIGRAATRSLRILVRQPVVWISALSLASNTAILYSLLTISGYIFGQSYDWAGLAQGLLFLGLLVGISLGLILFTINHRIYYLPKRRAWEKKLAGTIEKSGRRSQRHSAAVNNKTKHQSAVSPQPSRPQTGRSSLAMSLRRITTSTSRENLLKAETRKNINLAVAAADYINGISANDERQILPEQILTILTKYPAFGDLCEELRKLNLTFERAKLARILIDAMESKEEEAPATNKDENSTVGVAVSEPPPALVKSVHRAAAFEALEAPRPPSSRAVPVSGRAPRRPKATQSETTGSERPPPEWRLTIALPGSMLVTAGIFMLGWTASPNVHWLVPVAALAIFGCGFLLVSLSINLYLTDRYGAADTVHAMASMIMVAYALAFAFSMFVRPMYQRIGTQWGTSALGFFSLIVWLAPWLLTFAGSRFGKASAGKVVT